ncbi:hypothetical protein N0V85_009659 [Neurospora sp. IMI 360204]|nr:hypothetical protein N0V85_009659 [Neurospora sp. IMI 360204]
MSPTKRDRTSHPSSSPDSHTEKRPRVEEEDTGGRSSQSQGEAPMDLASSSGSEPDTSTTARPSSKPPIHPRPPLETERETSVFDDTTGLMADNEPEGHDEAEYDMDNGEDNDENMGVLTWGWSDAHFLHEQARKEDESDSSYSDPRIPLWQQEDRVFAGVILQDYPEIAAPVALSASHGPLEADRVPQLSIFCDGSIKNSMGQGWKKGGYRVAFRDPFLGTTPFVSQTNPARFASELTVQEHLQAFSSEQQEGVDIREGLAQVTDFTILEFATKPLSVPHVELAAISQSLESL